MINILVWSLTVFGTSNILVFSSLFKPLREKVVKVPVIGKLVHCILCISFWTGIFWGLAFYSPASSINAESPLIMRMLFDGCFGSSVGWLIFLAISDKMQGK